MTGLRRWPACALVAASLLAAAGCRRARPRLTRGDAAAVVLVGPGPAVPADVPTVMDEREGQAADAVSLTPNPAAAWRGALAANDERDEAVLVLPAMAAADAGAVDGGTSTHRLVLEVIPSPTLATTLEVRDERGEVVGRSVGRPGARHGLPNVAAAPGARLGLRLTGQVAADAGATGGPAAYLVVARLTALEGGDEREPNDTPAQATALAAAVDSPEAAGFFGGAKDQDWFRVPLSGAPAGMVLAVDLEPPPGLAAAVALVDGAQRAVTTARGRKGEPASLRNVAVEPLLATVSAADGGPGEPAFFVVVRPLAGAELDRRYVLRVRAEAAADSEREPNDSPAQATPLVEGSARGRLTVGDVDVFRWDGTGPGVVHVSPPPGVDVILETLTGDGKRLARVDKARGGQPEQVDVAGVALVRVTDRRGGGRSDEPYVVSVTRSVDGGVSTGGGP